MAGFTNEDYAAIDDVSIAELLWAIAWSFEKTHKTKCNSLSVIQYNSNKTQKKTQGNCVNRTF